MNIDKLKASLAGKIDSLEKYTEVVKSAGIPRPVDVMDYLPSSMRQLARYDFSYDWRVTDQYVRPLSNLGSSWWFMREQLRIATGVYPAPSTTLQHCVDTMRLQVWCIHCSTDPETPEAVAYTPDATAGFADRQVKVGSLAKLLRKLVPLLSDEWLQKIEAAHRAELDPTFELATSIEDVENVYRNMAGDSGCMRYDSSRWDLPGDLHPSHVYANVPGMGVAFHRNDSGNIVSRAVVWEDSQGNKKYLRVYGDGALRRKLECSGYTLSSLAGARIRAVHYEDRSSLKYVVPYLDGVGGNQESYDGTYGYIDMADTGFIRLVDSELAHKLKAAGIEVDRFKNHTAVSHILQPQDLGALRFTCPLSGIEVDKLNNTQQTHAVWLAGRVQNVLLTGYSLRRFPNPIRTFDPVTGLRQVHAESWVPTFMHDGYRYLDTDANRSELRYVRLDEKLYPGQGWARLSDTVVVDGQRRLKADVVTVYEADGTVSHMLRADIVSRKVRAEIREKGYHFAGTGDKAYIIHGSNPSAVTLRSNRVVDVNQHDVEVLFDGTRDFKSNTRLVNVFGTTIRIGRDDMLPTSMPALAWEKTTGANYDRCKDNPQAFMNRKAVEWRESYGAITGRRKLVEWVERRISNATYYGVGDVNRSFTLLGGRLVAHRFDHQSLENGVRPSCTAWAALTPEQRAEIAGGHIEQAECYFGVMTEMLAVSDSMLAEFDRQVAEFDRQVAEATAAAEARARELLAAADAAPATPAPVSANPHTTAQVVNSVLETLRQQAIAAGLNPDTYIVA